VLATDKIEREISGFKKIRAIRLTKDGQTLTQPTWADEIAVVDVGMEASWLLFPWAVNPTVSLQPGR